MTYFFANVIKRKTTVTASGFYYGLNDDNEACATKQAAWVEAARDVRLGGEYIATLSNTGEECTNHEMVERLVDLMEASDCDYATLHEWLDAEDEINAQRAYDIHCELQYEERAGK